MRARARALVTSLTSMDADALERDALAALAAAATPDDVERVRVGTSGGRGEAQARPPRGPGSRDGHDAQRRARRIEAAFAARERSFAGQSSTGG